ncbi:MULTISPECIES: ABC transporter ATP-binding protein [unclassified Leisingera]|uniref:ABC transporter ATP-binding protein n=1 Tax=unclassified Leisingera TaxID=2614906 RepID=UPI0021A63AE7|nr:MULTISPECIES: ABC transporter ATP-binding protein [unclassified Leisingera]UWQ30537.1 ABC transporter ATP-binding protein [Leisingera sp. M523]UWQ76956.1 ABC transporter ATP-binding protein [Leisingera sp. M658]
MVLKIRNVTKTYPGQTPENAVLRGVSLDLAAGSSLALTGDSGSGKSTLLHLAGALDRFDSGEIEVAGTPLSNLRDRQRAALRRNDVSLVFQQFNLIPSLSIWQNIALHARLGNRWDPDWGQVLADRLGLAGLLDRYPEQLSGGQQQRVAIGRALALRPKLLLADEPTGNLDETASAAVMDLMLELVRESGAALFLVTHSAAIARMLDQRLHLQLGQAA